MVGRILCCAIFCLIVLAKNVHILGQATNRKSTDFEVAVTAEIKEIIETLKSLNQLMVTIAGKMGEMEHISEKVNDIAVYTYVPEHYRKEYRVHYFHSPEGHYLYNYDQAVARCRAEGMEIATPQQLQVAWNQGMRVCSCGWLSDGSRRYPIQYPHPGCGGTTSGIITCSYSLTDVYCYY